MAKIEYFISSRSKERPHWVDFYKFLEKRGININTKVEKCDISVVLGGCLVNPLPLQGKKVLVFKKDEWKMVKWDFVFQPILQEYYDKMIDVTECNPKQIYEQINKQCTNL